MKKTHINLAIAAICIATLSACGSDNNTTDETANADANGLLAFVATRDSGYTVGQIERFSLINDDAAAGVYPAAESADIDVDVYNDSVYQIGKYGLDYLARFDADDVSEVPVQLSVADENESTLPNPYQVVFVNATKAYLIRYGSAKVWIINPTADNEADFKLGELDLSAYDADGVPDANSAVLVGDKLYVLMERLTSYVPIQNGYVAVFDTHADTEIDTGMGTVDGLLGVSLNVHNPIALQYSEENDALYIVGRGNYYGTVGTGDDIYSGGLETIDATSYASTLLIDDGTEADNNGFFNDLELVDGNKAYLKMYAGYGDNSVYTVDLASSTIAAEPVAGLSDVDITTLALDPTDRLWVGLNSDTPGFSIVNSDDDSIAKALVPTVLTPMNIVFLDRR